MASASVAVDGKIIGKIATGFLILLGVERGDGEDDLNYLVKKTVGLRIFKDDKNNMNLKKKFEIIKKLRLKNLPTVPTSLKDELNSNIFLRCDQNDLKIKLNMKNQEDFKIFKKVRDLKDSF